MSMRLNYLLLVALWSAFAVACGSNSHPSEHEDGDVDIDAVVDGDVSEDDEEETDSDGDQEQSDFAEPKFIALAPARFVSGGCEEVGYRYWTRVFFEIPRAFEIQDTKVTNRQFSDVMGFARYSEHGPYIFDDLCTREEVLVPDATVFFSLSDAAAFMNRLSEIHGYEPCYTCFDCSTGWPRGSLKPECRCYLSELWEDLTDCPGYRFPTAAEWEYSARAGALWDRLCATEPSRGLCDHYDWARPDWDELDETSCPVFLSKKKQANLFGVHDQFDDITGEAVITELNRTRQGGYLSDNDRFMTFEKDHVFAERAVIARMGGRSDRTAHHTRPFHLLSGDDLLFERALPGTVTATLRPVRTLPKGAPGLTVEPVYEKETFVEHTLPSPHSCRQPNIYESEIPVLTVINPYPAPVYTAPLAVMRGRLWNQSILGIQTWPASLPNLELPPSRAIQAGNPVEAWGAAWVGSNHGGFWAAHTDSESVWPVVTQMTGGRVRSSVYDPGSDRILGWHQCNLFVRDSAGRSKVLHFQKPVPALRVEETLHLCELDGLKTAGFGGLVSYRGDILLNDYVVTLDESNVLHYKAALFKLEGENWRLLTEFAHGSFPAFGPTQLAGAPYSQPVVYQDKLIIPSIPGALWVWDGHGTEILVSDTRLGRSKAEEFVTVAGDTLFVATSTRVFRVAGNQIIEENAFSKLPDAILGLAGDEGGSLYAGGYRRLIPNPDKPWESSLLPSLSARRADGWVTLDRSAYGNSLLAPLTTVYFGHNGKGLAAGTFIPDYGQILRFDGKSWYPWTERKYPKVKTAYTADGDLAWFANPLEIYRISDAEGVVREALPHSQGRQIVYLTGFDDRVYALGEWGLLLERRDGIWHDISIDASHFLFAGIFDRDEAILVTDTDFYKLGRFLHRLDLKTGSLEKWDVPPMDDCKCPIRVPVEMHTSYLDRASHILRDADGRVWLGRKDGIWLAERVGGSWRQLAPAVPEERFEINSLGFCGDAICRTSRKYPIHDSLSVLNLSWLEILRPTESGNWELTVRPLIQAPYVDMPRMTPLASATMPNGQLVMVGTSGLILEYGPRPTLPCDLPDFVTEPETEPYPQALDIASLRGGCVSSAQEASPACASGRCRIPAARYCIGGTDEAMMLGFAQADEFPAQAVALHEFEIDELPVTRQAYVDFLNTTDPALHGAYVAFDPDSAHETGAYRINYGAGGFSLSADADAVLDFATQDGALAYCDAQDMHLCSAIEWEAACRGFSDAIQSGYQQDGTRRSPFGVRGMGHGYYELVADFYAHDSLWASIPPGGDAGLAMLKGGWWDVERTCWSRTEAYFAAHPLNYTFRCCR